MGSSNVLRFLEEYEKFPCLWQKKCTDFNNRVKRDNAEQQLLATFGLSDIKELRQKIRSIRGTYNQEIAKITKSIKRGSGVYQPRLAWFTTAHRFLKLNLQDNLNESNYILPQFSVKWETNHEDEDSVGAKGVSTEVAIQSQSFSIANPAERLPTSRKRPKSCTPPIPRKTRAVDSLENAVQVLNQVTARLQSVDNEFISFGQHIASQLQCLPVEEAIKLQEEIQNLITAARLRNIRTSNLHVSSISSSTNDETHPQNNYSSDVHFDSLSADPQDRKVDFIYYCSPRS